MLKRSHPPVPSHSKQPSSLGFLQLQRLADSEWTKKATEVIRQHLEKEESEWEDGLLKQDKCLLLVFERNYDKVF
ncbi:unnamed protein product [Clavelina lepadiformis]|uniref:Uncharacterized protein n=1 Tax=Clavelina lepadiformis TaxID=159417 RepID=A0ABP0GH99_CLALP